MTLHSDLTKLIETCRLECTTAEQFAERILAEGWRKRTAGTVEVCERYVFHDCVNYRGHIQWTHGASKCTYGSCPRRRTENV